MRTKERGTTGPVVRRTGTGEPVGKEKPDFIIMTMKRLTTRKKRYLFYPIRDNPV